MITALPGMPLASPACRPPRMTPARGVTTLLRLRKPRHAYIVVTPLAGVMRGGAVVMRGGAVVMPWGDIFCKKVTPTRMDKIP